MDPTVEMDYRRDPTFFRNGGGDGRIPWEYVGLREFILPRHQGWDSFDGLNGWTRYSCGIFRRPKCENRRCRQIAVEFPFLPVHANGEAAGFRRGGSIRIPQERGHLWEFIDEHLQRTSNLSQSCISYRR
uniref:Uncharacterized protein n=1 Tax=Nelumbo nucifera TaxID=4432 RepID=A0A822YVQ8_NELNU|nr:TPA_asm: hypothetical protein HUJ06_006281 [Nelumbo nucifera]